MLLAGRNSGKEFPPILIFLHPIGDRLRKPLCKPSDNRFASRAQSRGLLHLLSEQITNRKIEMKFRALLAGIALCFAAAPSLVQAEDAKAGKTIVETAVAADGFETLVAAVKAGGLVEALSGEGPFTVFAPTDEAFAKLPKGTLESLLKPENKDKLVAILKYHVVPGKVMAADVVKLDEAETLAKKMVEIKVDGKKVMVNSSQVIKTDIECSNGVIHVINKVLIPE